MYISFQQRTVLAFESMLRLLGNSKPESDLVEITMNGPFSVVDAWSCSMTYCGREGNRNLCIPDDAGLSKEEAFPVYDSLDEVFISTFPEFGTFDRRKASEYVQEIFRKVCKALIRGDDTTALHEKETLRAFSERVIGTLKPVTC